MAESRRLRVILRRSSSGRTERQKKILRALGLKKINQQKEFPDVPWVRGMINKVSHLVEVEEIKG